MYCKIVTSVTMLGRTVSPCTTRTALKHRLKVTKHMTPLIYMHAFSNKENTLDALIAFYQFLFLTEEKLEYIFQILTVVIVSLPAFPHSTQTKKHGSHTSHSKTVVSKKSPYSRRHHHGV